MISTPKDVLAAYPVRKSKKDKAAFRADVTAYLAALGYAVKEERGSFGAVNVVAGDPDKADYLITAHYDTCAGMPFPNLITPCNFFPFVLYQSILVLIMFAFMGVVGGVAWLLSGDLKLSLTVGYCGIWLFLALMMFGPANKSNANDNTSGVITVLQIADNIPQPLREKVCFVLFDLEEAGLIGSASYRKNHKTATNRQLVLNLDCVGDGDHIGFFVTSKLRKSKVGIEKLDSIAGPIGDKRIFVRKKGFAYYPSDQANFPYGVGISALHKGPLGLYLGRIHTKRDTVLEDENIMLLSGRLIALISGHNEINDHLEECENEII